jgi:hypothetical protein
MATDDDRLATEAVEFRKQLDALVATTANAKKRYDITCARVLATTALLEQE